jgi:hypothetical protein
MAGGIITIRGAGAVTRGASLIFGDCAIAGAVARMTAIIRPPMNEPRHIVVLPFWARRYEFQSELGMNASGTRIFAGIAKI